MPQSHACGSRHAREAKQELSGTENHLVLVYIEAEIVVRDLEGKRQARETRDLIAYSQATTKGVRPLFDANVTSEWPLLKRTLAL